VSGEVSSIMYSLYIMVTTINAIIVEIKGLCSITPQIYPICPICPIWFNFTFYIYVSIQNKMTIEFNSFFGNISNSIYLVTGLNHIFSSVLYTSLVLSIMIIIMVMLIYPGEEKSPSWLIIKLFLYVFA
jgi:hypothetical protein